MLTELRGIHAPVDHRLGWRGSRVVESDETTTSNLLPVSGESGEKGRWPLPAAQSHQSLGWKMVPNVIPDTFFNEM